ncbi:MAG TPA: fatty acid desaturase [Xanthobacteraceae bacterium]|jgi:stearoyl-CoA desaturase (delta-9 desaturase)|nr:fatty acid desaturase [Xanthobacteraceae bacterium]
MDVRLHATLRSQLPLPNGVQLGRIFWPATILVSVYHLVACLAFLPWFFSWTGVLLAILGDYVFGVLGINLCYHRLLTHRGFRCPKWLEHTLAILGFCCLQDTPARWVAVHRRHHQYADEQPDPHSPLVSFFWGHMGWILVDNQELNRLGIYERYARDLLRDPFYKRLERYGWQLWIILLSWGAFFFGGLIAGLVTDETLLDATQFGLSLLIWGVFVRTIAVWHQTWAVNSFSHRWGYINYTTDEDSRNNFFVGIVSNGEGWHNNHHADPRSAKHGHLWWELDTTFLIIRLFVLVGLAHDVVMPNPRLAASPRAGRLATHEYQNLPTD